MPIAFLKMQGAGNDILVVDQRRDNQPPPPPERLRAWADAAGGPGFDQLMWVGPATEPSMDASYRVFNADGSEVEQCGNGVRCVTWMLARESGGQTVFRLESAAGPVEARMLPDGRVTVNMGAPVFEPELIPFEAAEAAKQYAIDVDGETVTAAVLSMGNPHCLIEVADVADVPNDRAHDRVELFVDVVVAQRIDHPMGAVANARQLPGQELLR